MWECLGVSDLNGKRINSQKWPAVLSNVSIVEYEHVNFVWEEVKFEDDPLMTVSKF